MGTQEEDDFIQIDIETDTFGKVQLRWFSLLLIFNAVVGIIVFEWAYAKTYILRNHPKDLNELFPVQQRFDAPKWTRWNFYPGAMFLLIPRIVGVVIGMIVVVILINITMIGKNGDEPIGQPRKWILLFWYKLGVNLIALVGMQTYMTSEYMTYDQVNFYEEYVGHRRMSTATQRDDFGEATETQRNQVDHERGTYMGKKTRVPPRGPGRAAIVICNHLGFIEILTLISSPLCPGMTPKEDLKNVPLLGTLCLGLQSLFVARGGTQAARDRLVEQIMERQEAIEVQQRSWQPFCLFAEGTISNGKCILPFKRGAFQGMRTVQPCFVKVNDSTVSLCTEGHDLIVIAIHMFCNLGFRKSTISIMPPFTPTDAMLEMHADKGNADWEIFAWCVRDAIAKAGDFAKRENIPIKERYEYYEFIAGRSPVLNVFGKTWHADQMAYQTLDDDLAN